jgi:hypothetical protein
MGRSATAAASLAFAVRASGETLSGTLTTWLSVSATPMDGSCEFMKDPIDSTTDPLLSFYLRQGMHCSIGTDSPAYGNGERCGACYRVRSTSNEGWSGDSPVPGAMSEAVVTVSTGGITGAGRFDCFPEAFEAITGAATGEFAIEFEQVECEAIQSPPAVTSFEEENAYFCKLVFNNIGGWGTLRAVEACLGEGRSNCRGMSRFSGQAWQDCPTGSGESMTFFLTQQDPSGQGNETVECVCPGAWPWERGDSCTCGGANFRGATLTETSTATTTRAPGSSGDGGPHWVSPSEGGGGQDTFQFDADGATTTQAVAAAGSSTDAPEPESSGAAAAGGRTLAAAAVAALGALAALQQR